MYLRVHSSDIYIVKVLTIGVYRLNRLLYTKEPNLNQPSHTHAHLSVARARMRFTARGLFVS